MAGKQRGISLEGLGFLIPTVTLMRMRKFKRCPPCYHMIATCMQYLWSSFGTDGRAHVLCWVEHFQAHGKLTFEEAIWNAGRRRGL